MPPRPRRSAPRPTASRSDDGPEWAPADPPAPPDATASGDAPRWTVSARTAAEAAHGAFRDALRDLAPDLAPATPFDVPLPTTLEPDRWADDGGPLGRLYAGARRLTPAEREAWEVREFARARVHAAAGVYARALRREGVGLPAALVAVRATVAEGGAFLPPGPAATTQRAAAQCCLEAYYAH